MTMPLAANQCPACHANGVVSDGWIYSGTGYANCAACGFERPTKARRRKKSKR